MSNRRTFHPSNSFVKKLTGRAAFLAALVCGLGSTGEIRHSIAQDRLPSAKADVGQNMPVLKSNVIPLEFDNRLLFIIPRESVDDNRMGAKAIYDLEPPALLTARFGEDDQLPWWAHEIEIDPNGTVKVRVNVLLRDQNLLDAAAAHVRMADSERLKVRSQEKNGGQPLEVVVQPLAVHWIRVEFMDLASEDRDPLAFGAADVSRTPREKELWLQMEPGALEQIAQLQRKNRLGVRVWYSYPNIAMVRASVINVTNTEMRDYLNAWLKNRNLNGEGEIFQHDIDDLNRFVRVRMWSRIIAEDPKAASLLVNNISALGNAACEPASLVPFVTGLSQSEQQKLAEHLGALPWFKSDSQSRETVDETGKSKGEGLGFGQVVEGKGGNKAFSIGGKTVFNLSKEEVETTLKRTGVVMQESKSEQGWMISHVQKYKLKKHAIEVGQSYSAEVSVGVGSVDGVFNGEPYRLTPISNDMLAKWSNELIMNVGRIEQARQPVRQGFGACRDGRDALKQLIEQLESLRGLTDKINVLEVAIDSLNEKASAAARLEGKKAGIQEAPGLLVPHHEPIDSDEAKDMARRCPGQVASMLASLETMLADVNADVRTKRNTVKTLRRELLDMIDDLDNLTTQLISSFENCEATELEHRIRSAYPQKPSFSERQLTSEIEKELAQRAELREKLHQMLTSWADAEVKLLSTKTEPAGHFLTAETILMGRLDAEKNINWLEGKREGLDEFKSWYTSTSAALHDAGEAKDIDNWFNATHLAGTQNAINGAKAAYAETKPLQKLEQLHALRLATDSELAKLKQTAATIKSQLRDLEKTENSLEVKVARLQSVVSSK
ncbi:MAG: hypothetical protein U0892_16760 [Pirellulales bacterium]